MHSHIERRLIAVSPNLAVALDVEPPSRIMEPGLHKSDCLVRVVVDYRPVIDLGGRSISAVNQGWAGSNLKRNTKAYKVL
jgi:hypothetical protein